LGGAIKKLRFVSYFIPDLRFETRCVSRGEVVGARAIRGGKLAKAVSGTAKRAALATQPPLGELTLAREGSDRSFLRKDGLEIRNFG
jgi:hypothetical protein